jgi:protein TonB
VKETSGATTRARAPDVEQTGASVPPTVEPEVPPAIEIPPTPEEIRAGLASPPPTPSLGELRDEPAFTPYTVPPEVTNREEVQRALVREYPPLLRDAGIGGTVNVWFFIDATGQVQDTRLVAAGEDARLDDAALRVAETMRFSPARNRDRRVPVWVQMPIKFEVR